MQSIIIYNDCITIKNHNSIFNGTCLRAGPFFIVISHTITLCCGRSPDHIHIFQETHKKNWLIAGKREVKKMNKLKNALEKMYFRMPAGWNFEESNTSKDLVLYVGEEAYAHYDADERTLLVNAYYRDVTAHFYVCSNNVSKFDIKRCIMNFIDAEGMMTKGLRKGFILTDYTMSETVLEDVIEEQAEYIRPTVAGQKCAWWQRPDGLTYLEWEDGEIVTVYDRSAMTYLFPFTEKVCQIPNKSKLRKNEALWRETLEAQAVKMAERREEETVNG